MAVEITACNFEQEVTNSEVPVLLDFWAEWCGPCQMLAPVLEGIEALHPEIKLGTVDTDDQAYLARQFGISSIPTLLFFKRWAGRCTEYGILRRGGNRGAHLSLMLRVFFAALQGAAGLPAAPLSV